MEIEINQITHEDIEGVIRRYILERTALQPDPIVENLAQEIMNFLAKKLDQVSTGR